MCRATLLASPELEHNLPEAGQVEPPLVHRSARNLLGSQADGLTEVQRPTASEEALQGALHLWASEAAPRSPLDLRAWTNSSPSSSRGALEQQCKAEVEAEAA